MRALLKGFVTFAVALALAAAVSAQTTSIGLSTVRVQRFGNENLLGFYTPQAGDWFGGTLAVGDFNGDGADDLATGISFDDGLTSNPVVDSGTIIVRYGVPGSGLATSLASTVLRESSLLHPAQRGDGFGYGLASCDFNGDRFDDLAVGAPNAVISGEPYAGGVQVHFGARDGIDFAGSLYLTQSTGGIPGDPEEEDHFGEELACGDFNADGFADLAISAPGEDGYEGMVEIVPGSMAGLDPGRTTAFKQGSGGMAGTAEDFDEFGSELAVGDFNGDGFADLAIGALGEDDARGQLSVVFGGPSGLTSSGNLFWSESVLGGQSEDSDEFSNGLAAGDFDGDHFTDLAIGIPGEAFGSQAEAGQVCVVYGGPGGFDRGRTQFWSQENIWFVGASETYDRFGFSLAAADFDHDGRADLAIGHPVEFQTGPADGAITVLMGSATGLSTARRRAIGAGFEGFPGDSNQHNKLFANTLTSGDFDGDGHADLAVGVPAEDENGIPDVGAETVIYGSLFADGFEFNNTALWSQTASGQIQFLNQLFVNATARRGTPTSKLGLQVALKNPTSLFPPLSVFVRVGTEAGFNNERTLKGSFFIDPQSLTMSNLFQMMAFTDGLGAGSKPRISLDLALVAPTGYAIIANFWNDNVNSLQFAASGFFAAAGDLSSRNIRIDFDWRAGNPGHLTMWKTRFLNGVPDSNGKVQMFSVDLPGQQSAVVNHVMAGMLSGQQPGTFGSLFLDEFSFQR